MPGETEMSAAATGTPEFAGRPEVDASGQFNLGWGAGPVAATLMAVAIAFSAFQLWTAIYAPLPSQVVRAVHVGFLLLLLFSFAANAAPKRKLRVALFVGLGVLAFVVGLYHWIFYVDIVIERAGAPNLADLVVGTVAVILVFLAGYVMMGAALPIICAAFLL